MAEYSKSEAETQGPVTVLAPAGKQPSQQPSALLLPHESESYLEFLNRELEKELTGPWVGLGRKLANEGTRLRVNNTRLRQALNACAWRDLAPRRNTPVDYEAIRPKIRSVEDIEEIEAHIKSWQPPPEPPKLEHLARVLQPLLDSKKRRFEEIVNLLYHLRYASLGLAAIEQNAINALASNQKGANGPSRSKRGIRLHSDYVDDKNRLTRAGWRIVGEPVVGSESRLEYEAAIVDMLNILGNNIFSNVESAGDIVDDTVQICRLDELFEKDLQAAFKKVIRKLTGNRPEKEDDIDPEIALAITFYENLPMLTNHERLVQSIHGSRKRSIESAIRRNAIRLRTLWVPTSERRLIR